MTNPTAQVTATIKAEEAPLGKLLWSILRPEAATAFTLYEVRIVRRETRSFVEWIYQDGHSRFFDFGERVAIHPNPTIG